MNKNISKGLSFLGIFSWIALIYISGCAYQKPLVVKPKINGLTGMYHKVNAGETLWGISKAYNVDLRKIVSINRIPNAAKIEKGQLIFIPGITKEEFSDSKKTTFLKNKKFIWPAEGRIISYFGSINNNKINKGIDIKINSKRGIFAASSGKVVFFDDLKGYEKTIILDHLDGFFSIYSGNQRFSVKLNDNIQQGQVIAKLKNSGSHNHKLHFEIRQGYRPKNPLYYLP